MLCSALLLLHKVALKRAALALALFTLVVRELLCFALLRRALASLSRGACALSVRDGVASSAFGALVGGGARRVELGTPSSCVASVRALG